MGRGTGVGGGRRGGEEIRYFEGGVKRGKRVGGVCKHTERYSECAGYRVAKIR